MATRIRILPDEVVNRIAAGEAVERPASVVKELVENAIDAEADRIVVEVAAGGKEAIRVSDNGCGMSRDDGVLALERHATSKISGMDDLDRLHTLGFRGEALPSIAAVSRMSVETCPPADGEGTRIVSEGGRVRDVSPAGRDQGTTVAVHGLFYNVPARKKFLKATETEFRHILTTVTGLALANPGISFVLTHGGREVLNVARSDRQGRAEAILGVKIGDHGVFMEAGASGIQIWGFVGRPDLAKRSGAQQAQVVNGRWVQHKGLTYAVYDGYGGLLTKGLYPSFALFLDIDPARVDVNVHPSKREVRFSDEGKVYRAVAEAVRSALRRAEIIPDVAADGSVPGAVSISPTSAGPVATPIRYPGQPSEGSELAADTPVATSSAYPPGPTGLEMGPQMALSLPVRAPIEGDRTADRAGLGSESPLQEDSGEISVWQLHRRYVLAHIKDGLIVIDQHLGHQRVIYERVLACFRAEPEAGQRLLFPLTLDFGPREADLIRRSIPLFEKMGFGIREFGGGTVVIDAIPQDLRDWQDGRLFRDILDDIADRGGTGEDDGAAEGGPTPFEHALAAAYARQTAVRPGAALSAREMQALIDQLFATQEPFVSPGGRSTVLRMSLDEIDRRFGR